MLQRGSLIRVWVAIHPRRTACKVRSLWVWVGSHPRRTETLLLIYRYVYKHRETKFNEHMVYCFVDKVMKFGECGVQTACVTGQKACVWVVLHPWRTGKVNVHVTNLKPSEIYSKEEYKIKRRFFLTYGQIIPAQVFLICSVQDVTTPRVSFNAQPTARMSLNAQ